MGELSDLPVKFILGTKWGLLFMGVGTFCAAMILLFPVPATQTFHIIIAIIGLALAPLSITINLYNLTHYCKKCGERRYDCYKPLLCLHTDDWRF